MSIDTDYAVLRSVLTNDYLLTGENLTGWAVEFGVYSGTSLGIIAEHMPVIGFDSFEGLPEDWREGFPRGTFGEDEIPLVAATAAMSLNAMIVPGLFEDTLPTFPFPRLGLVHIDCDLYSSTRTALGAVADNIGIGTVVVFDEYDGYPGWEDHEAKAWGEFCSAYGVVAEMIAKGKQERAYVIHDLGYL